MADPTPEKCKALTKSGARCKNSARMDGYCYIKSHGPNAPVKSREADDPYWRLNVQQRRFVDEYCIDGNGAAAARRAGYTGNPNTLSSTAYDLLRIPDISEAIDLRTERLAMSKGMALTRLGQFASGGLHHFIKVEIGDDGLKRFRVDLTSPEAQEHFHLLKKIKFDQNGLPVLETYDAMTAVEKILKIYGAFVDKVEHSGPGGGPISIGNDVLDELASMTAEEKASAFKDLIGGRSEST